jgi:hypothetical protein
VLLCSTLAPGEVFVFEIRQYYERMLLVITWRTSEMLSTQEKKGIRSNSRKYHMIASLFVSNYRVPSHRAKGVVLDLLYVPI